MGKLRKTSEYNEHPVVVVSGKMPGESKKSLRSIAFVFFIKRKNSSEAER